MLINKAATNMNMALGLTVWVRFSNSSSSRNNSFLNSENGFYDGGNAACSFTVTKIWLDLAIAVRRRLF